MLLFSLTIDGSVSGVDFPVHNMHRSGSGDPVGGG
jgi:hypothetical protein